MNNKIKQNNARNSTQLNKSFFLIFFIFRANLSLFPLLFFCLFVDYKSFIAFITSTSTTTHYKHSIAKLIMNFYEFSLAHFIARTHNL